MLGEYIYTWPVDVDVPKDGRHRRVRVTFTFRRLLSQQIQDLVASGPEDKADLRLLGEAIVGWQGDLADVLGEPVEYCPEAVEDVLQVTYMRMALGRTYPRSLGLPEAERKN